MNILAWLLYLKALVVLLQPVSSMGLCGAQLADMVASVCAGRGYYSATGETDSPLLSERQAKTFTAGGRKRTGKIVTECCHNHCSIQIIESYCAPIPKRQEKWYDRDRDFVNEENNIVEEPFRLPPQPVEDHTLVEETVPEVSQDIIETMSDQLDWDSIESETHNLLNDADLMLADQARDTSELAEAEELLHKDKIVVKLGTNITETQTDETFEEDAVSENSESKLSTSKTKGNSRTNRPTNRPTSRERNSRRKTSREKKKNKNKSRSREKKGKRRNKPKKNKNRHDRRRKGKKHERDDITQPTDELITDIRVLHPNVQVFAELPSSRSEPANIDDPTDPGSRSERSFLTTITAKLLDVMGLQQQNHNRRRR